MRLCDTGWLLLAWAGWSACAIGDANQPVDDRWLTVIWENDFIANDDSGYTNGIGVVWGQQLAALDETNVVGRVASFLPAFIGDDRQYEVSYRIAQAMFTPSDIQAEALIEDDRPYAGLLLGSSYLHSYNDHSALRYSLSLGVVGPASGAEQVQRAIHKLIRVDVANGWDNQLNNEFVFSVAAQSVNRITAGHFGSGLEYDGLLLGGADLGTSHSEIGAGFGLRVGRALASSFHNAFLVPGRSVNPLAVARKSQWQVYANLYGRYVFNDLPIEGNRRHDSHGVTLTHEQLLLSIGWLYHRDDWGVGISVQESTRTFEEKREDTLFANLALTFSY